MGDNFEGKSLFMITYLVMNVGTGETFHIFFRKCLSQSIEVQKTVKTTTKNCEIPQRFLSTPTITPLSSTVSPSVLVSEELSTAAPLLSGLRV